MIKNYELADGGRIAAATPEEFVRRLREGSWFDSEGTDEEFMKRFALRYNCTGWSSSVTRPNILWPTSENSDTSKSSAGIRCFFFSLELHAWLTIA